MAKVVEQHDDRLYELREFIKAPEIQTAEPAGRQGANYRKTKRVEVGGNVRRIESVD